MSIPGFSAACVLTVSSQPAAARRNSAPKIGWRYRGDAMIFSLNRRSFAARWFAAGCGLLALSVWAQRGTAPSCDPDNGGLKLPSGFCALVAADELGPARHL